jgi:hypothetical protein
LVSACGLGTRSSFARSGVCGHSTAWPSCNPSNFDDFFGVFDIMFSAAAVLANCYANVTRWGGLFRRQALL